MHDLRHSACIFDCRIIIALRLEVYLSTTFLGRNQHNVANMFDQPRIDHPTLGLCQHKRVCTLECVVILYVMHLDNRMTFPAFIRSLCCLAYMSITDAPPQTFQLPNIHPFYRVYRDYARSTASNPNKHIKIGFPRIVNTET